MPKKALNSLFDKLYCEYASEMNRHSNHSWTLAVHEQRSGDNPRLVCTIHLSLPHSTDEAFRLELWNLPFDEEVKQAGDALKGEWYDIREQKMLSFSATADDYPKIKNLAAAIKGVIEGDKAYPDRNWRWISPRTCRSLNRLAKCLRRQTVMIP